MKADHVRYRVVMNLSERSRIMKQYTTPELELVQFEAEDVITASGDTVLPEA